jgi:4-alpha-glucanotransferase
MRLPRTSGVQLHITSLPDGKLGASALAFVDWLVAAGQSWWQVLPLGPPNRHRSPYKSASAFAAWRGLLADPSAAVTGAQLEAFRSRHAFWADDWAAFAGGTRAL